MFLTSTVPVSVPSLFHSSSPLGPSLARKNSVPFDVREVTLELHCLNQGNVLDEYGARGRPIAFPQLVAVGAVVARKNSVPLTFVSSEGNPLLNQDECSWRGMVPVSVPSLFHSSSPLLPSLGTEIQRSVDVRQFASG